MPDDQQQQADVKKHQKNPQHGFVPSDAGEQKGVVQGPKPLGFFLGINLQGGGMFRFPEDFYQPEGGADEKSCKRNIDHRDQNEINQCLHNRLLQFGSTKQRAKGTASEKKIHSLFNQL
jgi:hypothetical protein